jgi:hypothetical protein
MLNFGNGVAWVSNTSSFLCRFVGDGMMMMRKMGVGFFPDDVR